MRRWFLRSFAGGLIAIGMVTSQPALIGRAHGACDAIPGVENAFAGARGALDRPFASPGEIVRVLAAPGCAPPLLSDDVASQLVTVLFTPTNPAAPRAAVVLTAAESCASVQSKLDACKTALGGGAVRCVAGESAALRAIRRGAKMELSFAFPDTDDLVDGPADDRTLAGSAAVAVTTTDDPLPCSVAATSCSEFIAAAGVVRACVDRLFTDGHCADVMDPVFSHFTALPPPNNYQALCSDPSPPCTGDPSAELRFTIDAAGNALVPMDWRGILVNEDVPVPRLLEVSLPLEAFAGSGQPIHIPEPAFLGSYTIRAGKLAPVFDPLADPAAPDMVGTLKLFGSADAAASVIRLARRSPAGLTCFAEGQSGELCATDGDCAEGTCGVRVCVGGPTRPGLPCATDGDCGSGGSCRAGIFDFATRVDATDLVVVGDGLIARALDPVPLDGLVQTATVNAFTASEAIIARNLDPALHTRADLNGDGDTRDDVVTLQNRQTGVRQSLGAPPLCGIEGEPLGRATVRVRQPPFSFSAVAGEGDVVAFLESEVGQKRCDLNGNKQVFETVLRVVRYGQGELTSDAEPITADAAPVINGQSIAVSDGSVFFRTTEASLPDQQLELVTVTPDGEPPHECPSGSTTPVASISADGRWVAFSHDCSDFVPGDDERDSSDVYLFDRVSRATERITPDNISGNYASISADGQAVAYLGATGDERALLNVYDRSTGVTETVAHNALGLDISGDGRVVLVTTSSGLTPDDVNGQRDVYVRDRLKGTTIRASVATDETGGADSSFVTQNFGRNGHVLNQNGQIVVFHTPNALASEDTNGVDDVYLRDIGAGTTELMSKASNGAVGNGFSSDASISADGRFVAFVSGATNLVAGDTNSWEDIFVRDRVLGITERVSVAADGRQADRFSFGAGISDDGRYVVFGTQSASLIGEDEVPFFFSASYIVDRLTRAIERGSERGDVVLSADGHSLVIGINRQIFVRGIDLQQPTLSADLDQDGKVDHEVLRVLDVSGPTAGAPLALGAASAAAVFDGNAAFVGPALPGASGSTVYRWQHGASEAESLGRPGTAAALSSSWIAALVRGTEDHTTVAAVHGLATPAGSWIDVGQPADALDISGSIVPFLTSEAVAGQSLNGDGDVADRVLQAFDASVPVLLPMNDVDGAPRLPTPALDFVIGGRPNAEVVAARTREGDLCGGPVDVQTCAIGPAGCASVAVCDLNGDGDCCDDVLQIYDVASRRLMNTGQAITPCRLEACDPRAPYRVLQDTVRFLTFEADQKKDLNGDNDTRDLVVRVLNVRQEFAMTSSLVAGLRGTGRAVPLEAGTMTQPLGAFAAGVCTGTAQACATDADCTTGSCFVPPGGCIRDLSLPGCDPRGPQPCGAANFCEPIFGSPGAGVCKTNEGPCASTEDCAAGAICNDTGQQIQRVASPLADVSGGTTFMSAGRCIQSLAIECVDDTECPPESVCGPLAKCVRDQGTCRTAADCAVGFTCELHLISASAADRDGDELPDPIDNCPAVPNILQIDTDQDGIGDDCDGQACGNGTVEPGEDCDSGIPAGDAICGPGCRISCAPTPLTGCMPPDAPGRSALFVHDHPDNRHDRLRWEWRGDTSLASFGDPLNTDGFALCLYDGDGLVTGVSILARGVCADAACWRKTRRGFRYRDGDLTPHGISLVVFERAVPGRVGRIRIEGRSGALPIQGFQRPAASMLTQLRNSSGSCWQGSYGAPFATDRLGTFRDRSD